MPLPIHTAPRFILLFTFFELFAIEQRRPLVPLLQTGLKATTGQLSRRSTTIARKALDLTSSIEQADIAGSASGSSHKACSLGFTELGKSLKVVDGHGLPSRAHNASLVPLREQPAHGEQGCAGQLRQLFSRKPDLASAVDPAQLIEQADQLMTQSHGNFLRRNFAVSFFELMKLLAQDVRDIASQLHRSLGERLENGGVPNQGCRGSQGLRRRAVPVLRPQS